MRAENRAWRFLGHIVFACFTVACILPFFLLIQASLTDHQAIIRDGYSFFPSEYSLDAYRYLLQGGSGILRSYAITLFITVVGTVSSLFMSALLAYPLSRRDYPARNPLAFIVFFTLLFNGGLVPTYLVYTQLFDLKNTIWALIVPGLLMNGINVMLIRTYFLTSIPMPVIESASIDGAGEWRTFRSIVLPLSMPILATVGLFQTIAYWNDWNNALIYLTDSKLYGIQPLLNRILMDAQFLAGNTSWGSANMINNSAPIETVKMAIAVIGVVPMLLAYPFFQKYFVKGIVVGAVKG
ncbi:carbohydrate ABC transporter permease [Paenibacillus lautus]|uniref:carbohydrate ABC transporter permease n=1 Tax=Paenibacillus lautus TaxID=1401 RepID=UPI003D9AA9C1